MPRSLLRRRSCREQPCLPRTNVLNRLFQLRPLSGKVWGVIVLIGIAIDAMIELKKRLVGYRLQGATFQWSPVSPTPGQRGS